MQNSKQINKIPPGGRRPHLKPRRSAKARPQPIETVTVFSHAARGVPPSWEWLAKAVDVGYLDHEAEYHARQRALRDAEKRAATAKPPWTLAEWKELGPGLRSVIPKPRGRTEVMEEARKRVRSHA